MELRAFAEHVLFATDLKEKLQCPTVITDDHPGKPWSAPKSPGRPRGLQFKRQGPSEFPGVHRLDQERERGRLLHFFANHELLATELMALVLLRFPDAPPAFRRGVLQTLKDEQAHTRAYLKRMRETGIEFGELPVSGYFWRTVSTMENPIDYVAGLSLTFEQANLDFCLHFSRLFERVGDLTTARLLGGIYRDEIGHVAYGLKWFRRWKDPAQSDWEAFCRQLKFPLSPQRAKGISFNVEGRRAAGLEAAFIAELDVFSQSRGRSPNVYLFNPFTEEEWAQGASFTPGQHQLQLALDLANLPQFLCRQDDIVLVPRRPSVAFLSEIKQAGFDLPEFMELPGGSIAPEAPVRGRKLGQLRPWAWGPESRKLLDPLLATITGQRPPELSALRALYSKSWSADLLSKWLQRCTDSWLCTEQEVGVEATTVAGALEAIASIRGRGHHKIVVKRAFASAGQHTLRLWEPALAEGQRRWLINTLEQGHALVIEPWLERELDFSVQFEMGTDGLKLCGYCGLMNDLKGQYQGNWAQPDYPRRMPRQAFSLLEPTGQRSERLRHFHEEVQALLQAELEAAGYSGPIGVDAFVYRTREGTCRLKPIVEINPRYTMGRLTLELMRHACQATAGTLRLISSTQTRKEGFPNLGAYARTLRERLPVSLEGRRGGRIRQGAICLNEPDLAQACLAVFQVDRATA